MKAINYFKNRLRSGINGVVIEWDDENNYHINVDGVCLEQYLNRVVMPKEIDISDYPGLISSPIQPIGVSKSTILCDYLTYFTEMERMRAVYHIKMSDDKQLKFPTISRDGGSTNSTIVKEDLKAFDIINRIAVENSFILRAKDGAVGTFDVYHRPLLLDFQELLMGNGSQSCKSLPIELKDSSGRIPYKHQEDALEELIEEKRRRKNHCIYIEVGMGKTYIVCSYLAYLSQRGELSKNVVYTLPKSAMKSVSSEFEAWGRRINIMQPTGGS